MKRNTIVYTSILALISLLSGCDTVVPVKEYKFKDFFTKNYADSLKSVAKGTLLCYNMCHLVKSDWDSILVIKPYINKNSIELLEIKNYSAISKEVSNQSLNESTCTLVFVNKGRYVGYAVLPRYPVDFTTIDKGKATQILWLTKKDCDKIYLKKLVNSKKILYKVEFNF